MRYIPYYYSSKPLSTKTLGKYKLIEIHALLVSGSTLWEDEPMSAQEICEVNDMVPVNNSQQPKAPSQDEVWIQVDTERTNLADFFTYEEAITTNPSLAEEGALLWRGWQILIDKNGQPAFLPKDIPMQLIPIAAAVAKVAV
jgi:hypothetical protein